MVRVAAVDIAGTRAASRLRCAGMASDPHPILAWLAQHKRRLAPLVLVGGIALVAGPLSNAAPRATSIRLRLPEPQRVRLVTVSVLDAGEPILGLQLAYEQGAPDRITEELELVPGHYELRVDVTRAAGAQPASATSIRALEVPADGVVVFDLTRGDA